MDFSGIANLFDQAIAAKRRAEAENKKKENDFRSMIMKSIVEEKLQKDRAEQQYRLQRMKIESDQLIASIRHKDMQDTLNYNRELKRQNDEYKKAAAKATYEYRKQVLAQGKTKLEEQAKHNRYMEGISLAKSLIDNSSKLQQLKYKKEMEAKFDRNQTRNLVDTSFQFANAYPDLTKSLLFANKELFSNNKDLEAAVNDIMRAKSIHRNNDGSFDVTKPDGTVDTISAEAITNIQTTLSNNGNANYGFGGGMAKLLVGLQDRHGGVEQTRNQIAVVQALMQYSNTGVIDDEGRKLISSAINSGTLTSNLADTINTYKKTGATLPTFHNINKPRKLTKSEQMLVDEGYNPEIFQHLLSRFGNNRALTKALYSAANLLKGSQDYHRVSGTIKNQIFNKPRSYEDTVGALNALFSLNAELGGLDPKDYVKAVKIAGSFSSKKFDTTKISKVKQDIQSMVKSEGSVSSKNMYQKAFQNYGDEEQAILKAILRKSGKITRDNVNSILKNMERNSSFLRTSNTETTTGDVKYTIDYKKLKEEAKDTAALHTLFQPLEEYFMTRIPPTRNHIISRVMSNINSLVGSMDFMSIISGLDVGNEYNPLDPFREKHAQKSDISFSLKTMDDIVAEAAAKKGKKIAEEKRKIAEEQAIIAAKEEEQRKAEEYTQSEQYRIDRVR